MCSMGWKNEKVNAGDTLEEGADARVAREGVSKFDEEHARAEAR